MMNKSVSDDPTISAHVAELIATGIVARGGFSLELYRTEVELRTRGVWKVEFVLKERYRHFNIRCAIVEVDSRTGQVMMHGYPLCNESPVMEHATNPLRYSLPDGHTGIRVDREPAPIEIDGGINYDEWGALFWDELGAQDPHHAPNWQKIFSDSIPNYPKLATILGEYASYVRFEGDDLVALMNECIRIADSAENPVALRVVKRILTACEIAKNENCSVTFIGD
jgi:hypothetical protein